MYVQNFFQRFPKVVSRGFVFLTAIAVVFLSSGVGLLAPQSVQAAVTPTVTNLVTSATTVKASSSPAAAFKIVIAVSLGETLSTVSVSATDSAATSFNPATDLAALSTTATSGIALYNDAGATAGSFDATDAVVDLSAISAWSGGRTTLTLASAGAAGTYYVVFRTASAAVNGHGFRLGLPVNAIATSANSPTITAVSTSAITVDTVAPTISGTFPATASTNIPISSFVTVNFNENIDPSTATPSNITFVKTSDSTAVPFSVRTLPSGFDLIPSTAPTYTASSRWSKPFVTTSGLFQIPSSGAITAQAVSGGYTSPTNGDIVYFQHGDFPMEVGVVTNGIKTAGTFKINDFALSGSQDIVKFRTPTITGLVTTTTSVTTGELMVANVTANPTDTRYNWHMVTTGERPTNSAFRLDGAGSAPTFASGSSFSSITPTDSSAINASSQVVGSAGGGINLAVGDMVFAKVTANADNLNSYNWHIVTATQNFTTDVIPGTLRLDGSGSAPTFAASSRISSMAPNAQGAVIDGTPTFSNGDIVFSSLTAGGLNLNAFNFHRVTGSGAPNGTGLRFDGAASALTASTSYTVTVTTGLKDAAGNALAANSTVQFTTGSTGSTNNTPPSVISSTPQPGNQTFPAAADIKLVFSQDMSVVGETSGTNSVTNASNVVLSLSNFGSPGTAVTAVRTYDSATKTLTINPSASLTASTEYIVQVLPAAQSATGASASQFFMAFRTASTSDSTRPKVLGVFPGVNAASVALPVGDISVGFSEDMDSSTVNTTNITISPVIAGTVTYDAPSRTGHFSPTAALLTSTTYTITVGTGVTDLSVNGLEGNGGVTNAVNTTTGAASSYKFSFGTAGTADATDPSVTFANADNFSVAVTFSEGMKTGGGPNAADNIANYTLESPVGSNISLAGKTVTYNGATQTAVIAGLSLQNGVAYKITVGNLTQDIAGRGITTTGSPAGNIAQGTVANSSTTGGQLGPGSGPTQTAGAMGMSPIRVTPMTKAAGATSNYLVEFPVVTSVPSGGSIVLTFPTGFDVTNATNATAATESFRNSDLNGPMTGTVTIASVSVNAGARSITLVTGGADTGANSFVSFDLKTIVNSTVPSSAGYTVDIKTKNASGVILESLTSGSFFLGQTGTLTLTVNVFNDTDGSGVKDGAETGIQNAKVFLFSMAAGGQQGTTNSSGVATFSNLASGDYMIGLEPSSVSGSTFNSAPQPINIAANTTKNLALTAAPYTITGTITGPASTALDVFATSMNGFARVAVNTGAGGSVSYSLPANANTTYTIGVGPAMPDSFLQPGSPPPPPPTFTFMPPPPLEVKMTTASVSGKNFSLSAANNTITGTVKDSSATGVNTAMVFARPVENSTGGGSSVGFGTGGQTDSSGNFTLNVVPGVYLVGAFKPGMPNVQDKQITVPTSGANTPASLNFVIDATTSLTISGSVKDNSGNAIPYAGVSGRKVNSSSDTTPVGGGMDNFVGGPTDANGSYTLYVAAGTWVVEAFAPEFGKLGSKTITVSTTSVSGQDFSAQTLSLGTIQGQATKATVAQQGVMVRADGASGANMGVTDTSGNYKLKVPAGTYTVTCFFPGVGESTPLTSVVVTADTDTTGKNCTLAAPITVTVNVTDGTNPITGAFVDARDANGRGVGTDTSTSSGANAVYTLTLAPGTYTIRAGHPAYGIIGSQASVSTTSSHTFTATAGQTYTVSGTVSVLGTGLSSAWVSLTGVPTGQTNNIYRGAQTGSNGTYSITVPNGVYFLRADKPGYKSTAETRITVSSANLASQNIALTTASRTITGTVTLSGAGVSSAFVDANDGAGGFAVAQTDATGAYSLAVDNGTWSLYAHSMGYEGGPVSVTVNNNSPSGQTITLSAISGYTVKAEKQETVTPTSGGYFTNTDIGTGFKVQVPANALGTSSNAATVKTQANTAMPNSSSGTVLKKNAVTISAVDSTGQQIKSLNDNITVVIPYTEADVSALASENDLVIGVWNDATSAYDVLSTTVDTAANTLTATVSHLSDFAPMYSVGGGAPGTPTGLSATAVTSALIRLSWSEITNATGYDIYRSTSSDGTFSRVGSDPTVSGGTTLTYDNTGLTAGTTYWYKVSAVNGASESAASSAVSASTPSAQASGGGGGGSPAPASTPAPIATTTTPTPAPAAVPAATPPAIVQPTTPPSAASVPSAAVPSAGSFKSRLATGSRGDEVKALQNFLKSQGADIYPEGLTTGFFGPLTQKAVGRFQIKNGIVASESDSGYGVFGPKTRAKINELLNASVSSVQQAPVQTPAQAPASSAAAIPPAGSYNKGIALGGRGDEVKALQNFLKSQGADVYPEGLTTGFFGPLTQKAVGRFQEKYGVVSDASDPGYGYVGPKTRAKINALLGL